MMPWPIGRCNSLDGYGQSNGNQRSTFVSFEVANWNNYTDPAFALAIRQPQLEVGPDIYIEPGNFKIFGAYSGQARRISFGTPLLI